jgi:V/A-type H+-transporting ATPase subunit K
MTSNRVVKLAVRGLLTVDLAVFLVAAIAAFLLWFNMPGIALAAPLLQEAGNSSNNTAVGAALAIGLAAIGSGIAVGIAGAAAIGAIAEKPDLLGRTLIIVGLAEGIAIYGLIISFMILVR